MSGDYFAFNRLHRVSLWFEGRFLGLGLQLEGVDLSLFLALGDLPQESDTLCSGFLFGEFGLFSEDAISSIEGILLVVEEGTY